MNIWGSVGRESRRRAAKTEALPGKTPVLTWRRKARRRAFAEVLVELPGLGAIGAVDGAIEIELVGARVRIVERSYR